MTTKKQPESFAPLTNVALCLSALETAMGREQHLPGMVAFYGPAGWGKTIAAEHAALVHRAYHVQVKSLWTKKAFLLAVLQEMRIAPSETCWAMAAQISQQLSLSGRPLIIDEFDHMVTQKQVELVRDLYEGSDAAVLLIGEEQMPNKLKAWERFHSRVLTFMAAQPADMEDANHLRKFYVKKVQIEDDLLEHALVGHRGNVRRISTQLVIFEQEALKAGKRKVDRDWWGDRPLNTGDVPQRDV
jgi:hypothetical protein